MLWIVVAAVVIAGLAGTALPILPGVPMIFFALLLGAWIDDFHHIGTYTLIILLGLTLLALLIDSVAAVLGAKRAGASPRALWGATLGAIVGLFFGLPGMLLGPFIGAVLAEIGAGRPLNMAGRAGLGTWVGMIVGTAAKLAIAFLMIGIFLFQRFI
ncbi:MAG: DUF456 family protein [Wenzhouxiangellaceae bacterium]